MEIRFNHMQILVHLHANKTFPYSLKGFALGLALIQRQKPNRLLIKKHCKSYPGLLLPFQPFYRSLYAVDDSVSCLCLMNVSCLCLCLSVSVSCRCLSHVSVSCLCLCLSHVTVCLMSHVSASVSLMLLSFPDIQAVRTHATCFLGVNS